VVEGLGAGLTPRAKMPLVEFPAADPALDAALATATPVAVEVQLA